MGHRERSIRRVKWRGSGATDEGEKEWLEGKEVGSKAKRFKRDKKRVVKICSASSSILKSLPCSIP